MKKLFILFCFAYCICTDVLAQNSWQRNTSISGAACSEIHDLGNGNILLLTTDGVYSSNDNAASWQKISSDMDSALSNFINDLEPDPLHRNGDTIYAFFRSNLFISSNAGLNWAPIDLSALPLNWNSSFAMKNNKLYIAINDNFTNKTKIYLSTDKGQNWSVCDSSDARLSLTTLNNEIYAWGLFGSQWAAKSPALMNINSSNKLANVNLAGMPGDADIRGLSIVNNNLVAMVPLYNSNFAIEATRLYGYDGNAWQYGTQFTANYLKLYSTGDVCYHPFFSENYFLKSTNGITWTQVPISPLNDYFSSIRKIAGKTYGTTRAGIFELDSILNMSPKVNGLTSLMLETITEFKGKLFISSGKYLFSSSDKMNFSKINGTSFSHYANKLTASDSYLYKYSPYLPNSEKVYISADGTTWDSLAMPVPAYIQRQILSVSKNGLFMTLTEPNFNKSYWFYKDKNNAWQNLTSAMPPALMQFNAEAGVNGDVVISFNEWVNSKAVANIYKMDSNFVFTKMKHTMGNVWYENTSIHNNVFYYLKNQMNAPDSLFKFSNDSLVFEKSLRYQPYQFYTNNPYSGQSFFYKEKDIFCLGFDSLQQSSVTMIGSDDFGSTWKSYNDGLSKNISINGLYFYDSVIIAVSSHGLYEYKKSTSVGIKTNQVKDNEFVVYPNPSNSDLGDLFVKSKNNLGSFEIELTDMQGKLLYTAHSNLDTFRIDTELISKGLFVLKIKSTKGIEHHKIILE